MSINANNIPNAQELALLRSRARRNVGASSIMSARAAPTNRPSTAVLSAIAIVDVNGHRAITPQVASVEWMNDSQKLVIPYGLIKTNNSPNMATQRAAARTVATINRGAGITGALIAQAWTNIRIAADETDVTALTPPAAWGTVGGDVFNAYSLTLAGGDYDDEGHFEPRSGEEEPCTLYITLRYGPDDTDIHVLSRSLIQDEEIPTTMARALSHAEIQGQLHDYASMIRDLNYSSTDFGKLNDDILRWNDDACQTRRDIDTYVPNFTVYTLGMIAALNMACLDNIPRLAWTRSYALSMGLLPNPTSRHNTEHVYTEQLPEEAEVLATINEHPDGTEGQRYLRGCMSLVAAFGACHLANDHTYKASDESILRKAKAYVYACRTALRDDEHIDLSNATNLPLTIRTTCHPFGLSSTYGMFKDGQRSRFIAEPLVIRDSVVPPPVAKVGLVVDQIGKIFALPIGEMFKKNFADVHGRLVTLRNTVVANATAYSALYRHYGHDAQRTLTAAEDNEVTSLLPIIAGFAEVFSVDADGNPIGANLSKILQKVRDDQGALAQMYANAFAKYRDDGENIASLLGQKPVVAPTPGA